MLHIYKHVYKHFNIQFRKVIEYEPFVTNKLMYIVVNCI